MHPHTCGVVHMFTNMCPQANVKTYMKIQILGFGEAWMDEYFCEKPFLSQCTHTKQQQTTNTLDKPQTPFMYNQKMWVLKSHFRWVRSIHHHVSGRKGRGGLQWWIGGGTGGTSCLVTRRVPSRQGQEARDHTPPPLAPFHSLPFPFFSSSKNLPPHMVGNEELHPPLERGWGYNRAWEGYNEPPGLRQLQSDWYQMMKLAASHINIHHIRSICPDEGVRRDTELLAHAVPAN